MNIAFYELDKAKRAAKALMYSVNDRESNYIIQVRGDIDLDDDPVFGGVDLKFNGKTWTADVDGKNVPDSRFDFSAADFYLDIKEPS